MMLRPGGYLVGQGDGVKIEQDTFTCAHCNRVVFVKPQSDPADLGGLCKQCMGLICPSCVGRGCDPLEKKLERAEARDRFLRSIA